MDAFIQGFSLSFGLILAIGAQNAFVLRQGLKREFVFAVCLTCALSDALLISAGVAGFGWIAEAAPWIAPAFKYGGATFLIWYGVLNARSAWRGGGALEAAGGKDRTLAATLAICLALTWLNPHVYLDTLVLIGVYSTQSSNPLVFGVGAVLASFTFFFSLGYGARLLAPLFARPAAWRVLDGVVALTMWIIALILLIG